MSTVRKIAALAGVSPSTVSRVLTNSTPVNDSTRQKVLSAIETLNAPAAEMPRLKDRTVGIIMPASTVSDPNGHQSLFTIIASFVETLSSHGIANTTLVYDEQAVSPTSILSPALDGYMIIGTRSSQEQCLLSALAQMDVPHVLINRQAVNNKLVCICFDEESSSCAAVEHFISLGHRNIAYVGGEVDFQNTRRRFEGYRRALENHNIPLQNKYVLYGQFSELSGYKIGRDILELSPRPSAIFFASDAIAVGCMRYFSEQSVNVPDDIAIIGFGNTEMCRHVLPSMSTISQPDKEVGCVAADMISHMWQSEEISHADIYMQTKLILRASSGGALAGSEGKV